MILSILSNDYAGTFSCVKHLANQHIFSNLQPLWSGWFVDKFHSLNCRNNMVPFFLSSGTASLGYLYYTRLILIVVISD